MSHYQGIILFCIATALIGCDGPAIERDLTALPEVDTGYQPSAPLEIPPSLTQLPTPRG